MFGALPMRRLSLYLLREDLERASLLLAQAGVLDPEPADEMGRLDELPGDYYASVYAAARGHFDKVFRFLHPNGTMTVGEESAGGSRLKPVSETELKNMAERLASVWQACSQCEELHRRLHDQRVAVERERSAIEVFSRLDMDLGHLQGDHRFLDVRVGTLDRSQLGRLRDALALVGHSVMEFHREGEVSQVVITGLQGDEDELRPVLKSAGFHALDVPTGLKGRPEELRHELALKEAAVEREAAELRAGIDDMRSDQADLIEQAIGMLRAAAPLAALSTGLRAKGGLAHLEGWIPESEVAGLRKRLSREVPAHHLEARRPNVEELPDVPFVQRYPRWMRPFADLVRGYGTPRYDEFDPTWLFAISFTLMFGMMFGDVGHGLVIAGAAVVFRKQLKQFTAFGVLAGLSSTVFGFLYGSIFGYEHILHPLWMSPLSDPMRLLMLALYWGIGFILLATALSAWNLWRHGNRRRALYGVKGLAGLLFYLGGLYVLSRMARGLEVGFLHGLFVILPLGAILLEVWRTTRASTGERVLVTFMEGFEAVMGYVSNTLSFLRVAAFSLNHAALAIAVLTLAGMLDTLGHWIAVVIGNLIILILEGGIVLIQVLRLEYYEGFARFFGGDGRAYRPLTLDSAAGRELGGGA